MYFVTVLSLAAELSVVMKNGDVDNGDHGKLICEHF